mmetsp:Transcript_186/g.583  ORF Transcript_186/g.583 Transcript_186/m.583 type:complete len:230 (-) Transcript_186:135-824(-)
MISQPEAAATGKGRVSVTTQAPGRIAAACSAMACSSASEKAVQWAKTSVAPSKLTCAASPSSSSKSGAAGLGLRAAYASATPRLAAWSGAEFSTPRSRPQACGRRSPAAATARPEPEPRSTKSPGVAGKPPWSSTARRMLAMAQKPISPYIASVPPPARNASPPCVAEPHSASGDEARALARCSGRIEDSTRYSCSRASSASSCRISSKPSSIRSFSSAQCSPLDDSAP